MKTKTTYNILKTLLFLSIIVVLASCSRKKNKWANRNFHAMGTYYNILYHGNIALEEGAHQLNSNYPDDYWEVLPVERIGSPESIEYGQMVEVPPAVMPQRPRSKKEDKEKKNSLQKEGSERTVEEAFSAFDNVGSDNSGRNNQFGNQRGGRDQSGMNQGGRNQGMNQGGMYQGQTGQGGRSQSMNQGGMNPSQSGQGGFVQGSRGQGGMNQGGRGGMSPRGQSGQMNQGGRGGLNQGRQNQGGFRGQSGINQGRGSQSGRSQGRGNQGGFSGAAGLESGRSALAGVSREEDISADEAFKAAEDKAAKGIQKHNMLIQGEEYNPQMKDAFLLLGKARYYQKRFFPALEAFNYILNKYDDEEVMISAEIWREKTYMRLENYDRAITNLNMILENNEELSEDDIVDASSALAQAYLKTNRKEQAINALNTAITQTRNNEKKGRFLFIKGQIFQRLNQIDSSNTAFNQVIALKRKTPRVYMINAFMEKSKNFDFETGDREKELDTLKRLLADRENRPFLDIINYRTAEYFKELDDMPKAITYYNKSLRTNTSNHGLKERIYRTLGDYNFDNANYKEAGAYYDSTMVNLPEASLAYRRLRRKRLSLNDVIMYEEVAARNDSILNLVYMSPEGRQAYFQEYVDSLKTKAIADAEKAIKEDKKAEHLAGNIFNQQPSQAGAGRGFYFYDSQQIASGLASFRQIWGDRALQDNWRIERGRDLSTEEKEETTKKDFMAAIEANPRYKVETYLAEIPKDEDQIEELEDDRNFAYYQLGVIYHEKFSEYKLATKKLEDLLENEPEERLVQPAKYNLYKIYTQLEQEDQAEKWKQDILMNHPDSRYAKILKNPAGLKDDESNPILIYNRLYKDYRAGKYQYVIDQAEEYSEVFLGHAMVPKFELLKATAIGRLYGFDAYEQALDYVALAYPQSEEGKKAEQIIKESLPKMKRSEFVTDSKGNYNLIYPFVAENREEAEQLQDTINTAIEELEERGLSTSVDIYSPEKIFLVVRGLRSRMGAEGFGEKLKKEEEYNIDRDNFGISSENYEILLIHKNLSQYREQFKE